MKFLFIMLLVFSSCASQQTISDSAPVNIEMSLYKNGTKIDSMKSITNLGSQAQVLKKSSDMETQFQATPTLGELEGEEGIILKASAVHVSQRFGKLGLKSKLFLKINKEAKFEVMENGDNISLHIIIKDLN